MRFLCNLCSFFVFISIYILVANPIYATTSKKIASTNNEKILRLYQDADWSNNTQSAESIWQGVNTALSEIDHTIQGYTIQLVKKDHRGNVVRSFRNILDFEKDETALALVAGIHSPPLIKYRDFINKNKLLTLVPWAAGSPITRYPHSENWIFRVSLDDMKVGSFLIDYAINQKGCKAPHLFLENTAWGKSNLESLTSALKEHNFPVAPVTQFDWNMKSYTARSKIQNIVENKSDCIILVANSIEGAEVAMAMESLPTSQRIPIISHWGITGGQFHKKVSMHIRESIDLSFVQSCFSFMNKPLSGKGRKVFNTAKKLFPEKIKHPIDIRSPVGFVHGYDLTLIFIEAMKNVKLTDDIKKNRDLLRISLENIKTPIEGLVRRYEKPFSMYSETNIHAHEALTKDNYCMAAYGSADEIFLLTESR